MDEPFTYDADVDPDPEDWLALDEQDRLDAVVESHLDLPAWHPELPNPTVHAVLHTIVESQVASGDEIPVRSVLSRLQGEGLDRHDAIHAIGAVLMGHLHELMQADETDRTIDSNPAYYRELLALTAEGWRRGDPFDP